MVSSCFGGLVKGAVCLFRLRSLVQGKTWGDASTNDARVSHGGEVLRIYVVHICFIVSAFLLYSDFDLLLTFARGLFVFRSFTRRVIPTFSPLGYALSGSGPSVMLFSVPSALVRIYTLITMAFVGYALQGLKIPYLKSAKIGVLVRYIKAFFSSWPSNGFRMLWTKYRFGSAAGKSHAPVVSVLRE